MMTGDADAEELARIELVMASETGTKLCPCHMAASAARRVTTGRVAATVLVAVVEAAEDDAEVDADAVEEVATVTGLYT